MLTTKRKPVPVGEILREEFMQPLGLTQGALAAAMGVQRKHVNELCNDRRDVTVPTALILARVFGNSPDFWLDVQRRSDLWEAMNSLRERERIERAKPVPRARTAAGLSTRRATVKAGLLLRAQVSRQVGTLADIKGLGWEGDLDKMRRGRRSGS
jgi:addiction module HigA family antidote